ncbi:hypothetical protein C7972_110139 [Arenibacter sp. ARW7G5Y1]|nr:hypothetical protein C7972_110139 [Arenibacter sp. ARW7G5Y1]
MSKLGNWPKKLKARGRHAFQPQNPLHIQEARHTLYADDFSRGFYGAITVKLSKNITYCADGLFFAKYILIH